MKNNKPKPKKKTYKSAESRARQLAGLRGVRIADHVVGADHIEKVCDKGLLASFTEDQRKQVIDLYCQGLTLPAISERTGISVTVCHTIKISALDHDSQFRDKMRSMAIKDKLYTLVDSAAERAIELMPEMSAKDTVLALGIAADKLAAMERNKGPESLHQHVHVHTTQEVGSAFLDAMKPK